MWQTSITRVDANDVETPVTTVGEAELALATLGIEYSAIEADEPSYGIWSVELLGRHEVDAHRGDEVWESGDGFRFVVPQP